MATINIAYDYLDPKKNYRESTELASVNGLFARSGLRKKRLMWDYLISKLILY